MTSKWKKAKKALGMNLCLYVPKTMDDTSSSSSSSSFSNRPNNNNSDAALLSPAHWAPTPPRPNSPSPSSLPLKLSKSSSKSSSKTCSICLTKMKPGGGQAIFTAECSHSFHFHCITTSVNHGNHICPVCRSKWKDIPLLGSTAPTVPPMPWRLPPPRRHVVPLLQSPEPAMFDDDELLPETDHLREAAPPTRTIEVRSFPEVSAAPRGDSYDDFTVLVHLRAAAVTAAAARRAPVDLITVLDISGSMAGTKLALLKRAMGFVIQNLGSNDRLSVVAFSSTARRLFPLQRMSDSGRQQALQAVNALVASGGTNIAEGLRKGAKVMVDRRWKNPVASAILLSDGQDTYTVNNQTQPNYRVLLPSSIQVPVHAFGFGADHDASSMHSISEFSGGTFSFIEAESMIQDAFAQCIGGLLSVVAQEVRVAVECSPGVCVKALRAGSYNSRVAADGRSGFVEVGDMYADEERDFLLSVELAAEKSEVMKVRCVYRDPITKEVAVLNEEVLVVERGERMGAVSMEVDKQKNRVRAAEAMEKARGAAERGDLAGAAAVLEDCRRVVAGTVSGKGREKLCVALDAELREMQDRMGSKHVYEASGRAYVLSGLSSHSWQRATARGDSTDGSSLVRAYQTPSMTEMLTRSQARLLQPLLRPKPR